MELKLKVRELASHYYQNIVTNRRTLHANPELSFQEYNTARFVAEKLKEIGIAPTEGVANTGVVALIKGKNPDKKTIALRADLDALPITEANDVPYKSKNEGVMHACGHDVHTASLLGTARILHDLKDNFEGTVKLIFQPGEEIAAGAQAMVDDGLWDKAPKPEVVYGQHVMPSLAGTVSYSSGDAMAMADSWRVTLHGEGSHGSQPQDSIDPIVLGAHIITRIQGIVSREIDPRAAAVVTVGTFHAGLKENIIPASAEFTLNVRNLDPDTRETVLAALRRIIKGEAATSGAPEPTIEEISRFPRNYNDPDETAAAVTAMQQEFGDDAVLEVPPAMGSEDFGILASTIGVPSVFWMFGGHTQKRLDSGQVPVNHSPYFAPVLEPTLTTGLRAALTVLLSKLGS